MAAIRASGVTKYYGELQALNGLSLEVDRGELYGFLGPNGAGKTTTLEILTGQLLPDAGAVEVLGTDPVATPLETRRRVGVLPEQASPPSFLTPREYFDFVAAVRELDEDVLTQRRETWVHRLGFEAQLDTLCADLSRGQQQKVMVTATFLHDPDVAFIDEPLVNLDPIVQERVKGYLQEFVDADNAIFLSTHHIGVAAELCTRVGIVDAGRLITERVGDEIGDGDRLLETFLRTVGEPGRVAGEQPSPVSPAEVGIESASAAASNPTVTREEDSGQDGPPDGHDR